jgi:hypothetical protein
VCFVPQTKVQSKDHMLGHHLAKGAKATKGFWHVYVPAQEVTQSFDFFYLAVGSFTSFLVGRAGFASKGGKKRSVYVWMML